VQFVRKFHIRLVLHILHFVRQFLVECGRRAEDRIRSS